MTHLFLLGLLAGAVQSPSAAQVDELRGVVLSSSGAPIAGATVVLTCGVWSQTRTTADAGEFRFDDVPAGACEIRVSAGGRADHTLPVTASGPPVRVVLPPGAPAAPLAPATTSPLTTLPDTIDLRYDASGSPSPDGWRLTGRSSWRDGGVAPGALAAISPDLESAGERGWRAGISARGRGPFGTLFTAEANLRRTTGAASLLSDVTGMAVPGTGSWSTLFDPSRPTQIGDLRLRVERMLRLGGAEVTAFGEVFRSFPVGRGMDGGPVVPGSKPSARTGTAVRGGARIRF